MVRESNQNVFLIQIDAANFAELEISEFEISRFDCNFSFFYSWGVVRNIRWEEDRGDIGGGYARGRGIRQSQTGCDKNMWTIKQNYMILHECRLLVMLS